MESKLRKLKPTHIIFIIVTFVVVIISVSIASIIFSNPYFGKQTNISNLSSYTKGKASDKDTVERIKYNLYNTISQNVDQSINAAKISDIKIRDNTFSQKYSEETQSYSVYFIVDSETLKQTYQVAYEWSENPNQQLDEWGIYVKCPTTDQLIYDEFDCRDMFIDMIGTNDPNAQLFPQYGELYEIWANISDGKIQNLDIKIYSCVASVADIIEANARNWLTSHDITEEKYSITTTYCVI